MSDHDPKSRPGGRSHDPAGDGDEEALAAVYRGSEQEQPSADLDRRIAAAAAAATARRARQRRLPWAAGGLATAAVLVLAVTLVLDEGSVPAPEFEPAPLAPPTPARMATEEADRERSVGGAAAQAQQGSGPDGAANRDRELRALRESAVEELAPAPTAPAADTIERVQVTASRREAADAAPEREAVTYADPGCPRPFEIPPGATLRWIPDGIEVAVDGTTFLLRCVDGQWARQEAGSAAERDQTSR